MFGYYVRLMRLIALSMGLDENYFQPYFDDPITVMRAQYYTTVRSQPQKGVFAAGVITPF
jgi:isopenicillin N synthase-like dioxygenase